LHKKIFNILRKAKIRIKSILTNVLEEEGKGLKRFAGLRFNGLRLEPFSI
jgi:hypothetical protein